MVDQDIIKWMRTTLVLMLLGSSPNLHAWDAKLPKLADVPATQPMVLDGTWRLATNNARIRIEAGRVYALDPWVYLLLWKVKPQMVVMQNFRELQIGHFAADDLLLAGPAALSLVNLDALQVKVKGALGPVTYKLNLVEAADPDALLTLWNSLSDRSPPSSDIPPAQLPDDDVFVPEANAPSCEKTTTDPDSGMTICL